jgi:hypothetical protein
MSDKQSTRDRVWADIKAKYPRRDQQISAWTSTNLIALIGDAEWAEMHAGNCGGCGAGGARLYPRGWRCGRCL